ncbi:hypothetical protein [Vibrio splendidus]|uniref:hypothetical protein n=1 Tax=Vibrio splendidus TaxID=29497 RepID=UPI003D11E2FA
MKNQSEIELVKAICRADLKKTELSVLLHLMKKKEATVSDSNSDLAKQVGIAQPNFVRALNGLKSANVVGVRTNGIFVKSKNSWGKK